MIYLGPCEGSTVYKMRKGLRDSKQKKCDWYPMEDSLDLLRNIDKEILEWTRDDNEGHSIYEFYDSEFDSDDEYSPSPLALRVYNSDSEEGSDDETVYIGKDLPVF